MFASPPNVPNTADVQSFGHLKSRILHVLMAESTIRILLLINTSVFLSAVLHSSVLPCFGRWMDAFDTACVLYFIGEAVLKIWTHRRGRYCVSRWSQFDFAIARASSSVLLAKFVELPAGLMAGIWMLCGVVGLRAVRMLRYRPASQPLSPVRAPIVVVAAVNSVLLDVPDPVPPNHGSWTRFRVSFLIVQLGFRMFSRLHGLFDTLVLHPVSKGRGASLDGLLLPCLRRLVGGAYLQGSSRTSAEWRWLSLPRTCSPT